MGRSRVRNGGAALRVLVKYLLLEIPGWMLAGLVAVLLHEWLGISATVAGLLVGVWILKDLVLYPWLRDAFVGDARSETDKLLTADGVVVKPLDPVGVVRVGAELWRAETRPGAASIPEGRPVRVRAVRGLTLEVAETERRSDARAQ